MFRFALVKLWQLLLVYGLASGIIFAAMQSLEDPVSLKFSKYPNPEQVVAEKHRLGLDRPVLEQFGLFHRKFLSFDWEKSLLTGRGSWEDFKLYFPATLELTLLALLIGSVVGAALALFAREKSGRFIGRVAMSFASVGLVVPIFWVGLISLVFGSLWLGWFPMGGRFDLALIPPPEVTGLLLLDSLLAGDLWSFWDALRYLFLPAICLAVYPAANVSAVLYGRLKEPGIVALRVALLARGVGPLSLFFKHYLRVGAAPVVTVLGTTFGALLGGAVLTESVFSWPGLGRYVITSIVERDLFVAQYLLLVLILMVYVVAFISDLVVQALMVERDSVEDA